MRALLVITVAVFLFSSCRSTRKIQTAIAKKDSIGIVTAPIENVEDSSAIIRETTVSCRLKRSPSPRLMQKWMWTTWAAMVRKKM